MNGGWGNTTYSPPLRFGGPSHWGPPKMVTGQPSEVDV
eukprot:CAMPEP_0174364506 /NCGR_PEP_ID=MMETSP0811_2-20130205/73185_1 /TAXON_ID=73025 ORGANISM="Eutreptiella gymnastica-like, Strain CCMP1594" /NCGR_SAMPLE_ID=MMETSP0811_2 /ASSEMBLY_ACC=CAM_ASM_000667 /LENGTH=37 /DNA_ID= /DNA_START= /DNA_END= /DNA_ORIENTATION=